MPHKQSNSKSKHSNRQAKRKTKEGKIIGYQPGEAEKILETKTQLGIRPLIEELAEKSHGTNREQGR